MLSNTLNTNEIKKSDGSEVEFEHQGTEGRKTIYQQVAETPSQPHRLTISHSETGLAMKLRRRSVVRFDKTVLSSVDNATPVTCSAYIVMDIPVGAITTSAEPTNVLSELLSFVATTGAATTVLFNGTGTGSVALLNGSI